MGSRVDVVPASAVEVRFWRGSGTSTYGLDRLSVDEVLAAGPVREFRWYKGRRFYSGWYWSATTGGLVAYESRLELARIMLADFDPEVVGIAAQPFQLTGRDGGVLRRHVPDLLLQRADGGVLVVDVKPAHRMQDPAVRAVFDWTATVVGWRFEAWCGADATLLSNVAFLAGSGTVLVIAIGRSRSARRRRRRRRGVAVVTRVFVPRGGTAAVSTEARPGGARARRRCDEVAVAEQAAGRHRLKVRNLRR